jgi:transposase-like protein
VVAAVLKATHAAEDVTPAREKALEVVGKLKDQRMMKDAKILESGVHETLAYYAFPDEHWRRIRTNNPLERILREIRRRTKVVGSFPDGQSCLNLAAATLRHVTGSEWSTKRYLSMELLRKHHGTTVTA